MSVSSEFKTTSEMTAALEFVQYLEALESGSLVTSAGLNRSLERLAANTDALLDVLSASSQLFITGGGVIAWSSSTGSLTRSTDLTVNYPHPIGGSANNILGSGTSVSLTTAGEVAYVVVDRQTTGASLSVSVATDMADYLSTIAAASDRLDHQVLAVRDGTDIILWDGRRILDTFALSNNGYTDTQYGQQSELTTVHGNQKENFRLFLTGGGNISWDASSELFTWDATLVLEYPSEAGTNTILTSGSPATIAAGEILYATLSRQPGSAVDITSSLTVVSDGSVPNTDDVVVLAIHNPVDGRLYLYDGTALSDGETILLGGTRSGVQWFYQEPGVGNSTSFPTGGTIQFTDWTEGGSSPSRSYQIGTHELMVYRNGIKAKASEAYWAGSFPDGHLVGSISDDDQYVEEDEGTGTGTRILWLRDNTDDELGHDTGIRSPASPFTWPSSAELVEGFVGLQGEGPSPVESWGIYPEPGGGPLEGDVKLKEGAGVTLSYDLANNAILLEISSTAGVSSLEASGGSEGQQGGDLILEGGTLVTLDDSVAGTITFNVARAADLEDAINGAGSSVVGTNPPDADNPLMTLQDVYDLIFADATHMPIRGFDVIRSDNSEDLEVCAGMVVLEGVPYYINQVETVTTSDIISSETISADTWHYLYFEAPSSGTTPDIVFSATAPDAEGLHPSPPSGELRFITSVYVNSSNEFGRMLKRGSYVVLDDHIDITSGLGLSVTGTQTADLTGLVPETGYASVRLKLTYTLDSSSSSDDVTVTYRSGAASTNKQIHIPFVADAQVTFEFEVQPSHVTQSFTITPSISGVASIDSIELVGYTEGRYYFGW